MISKVCRTAGLLLLALVLTACSKQPSEPIRSAADDTVAEHAIKHTDPKYRCPMHPDVVRDWSKSNPGRTLRQPTRERLDLARFAFRRP
jgi:hypothetical protein